MRVSSIIRTSPRALQSLILYGLTLLIALGLKYHYSRAGSEDLLWILAPTAGLVEFISGTPFENEVNTGYVSHERHVIIAPSCAGINFMIITFCMTAFSGLKTLTGVRVRYIWPMVSLITAYGLTLGTNTFRIITSMAVYESEFLQGSISMDLIHRIQGILIFFISLNLFYLILRKILDMFQHHPSEKKTDTDFSMNYPAAPINRDLRFAPTNSRVSTRHSGKSEGLIRNLDSRFRGNDRIAASSGVSNPGFAIKQTMDELKGLSPIFWYCAVTIGIPLLGRAYHEQGDTFFQHNAVILSVCLLTFVLFSLIRLSCQYLFFKIRYRKENGIKGYSL